MRLKPLLLLIAAVLVVGAGAWHWWYRTSPAFAVLAAGKALRDGNRLTFERYVNVDRVSEQVADEYINFHLGQHLRESPTDEALGTSVVLVDRLKPILAGQVRSLIADVVNRGATSFVGAQEDTGWIAAFDTLLDSARIVGQGRIQQEGRLALVELPVQRSSQDSGIIIVFRMEDTPAGWQVVGIDNFRKVILEPWRAEEKRKLRAKAIEASMRADLRNLVVAQEEFFARNGDYAGGIVAGPQLNGRGGSGRVTYMPFAGNGITVTYISPSGWTATAVNAEVTVKCGIFVGPSANSPNPAVNQEGNPGCW